MLFLALLIAVVFGFQVLRTLGVLRPCLLLSGGLALGVFSELFLCNALLRLGANLGVAVSCGLAVLVALSLVLTRGLRVQALSDLWEERSEAVEILVLTVCSVWVWLGTNASQIGLSDQDYWLHTPLQRFLLDGMFPPRNPYFLQLPLYGHYGRDLLVAIAAWLGSWDVFRSQMLVTSFCQALSLPTLYLGFRHTTGSRLQAGLATLFLYLGTNTAYRAGWIDEFVSHSPVVHLLWALTVLFFGIWWHGRDLPTTLALGLLLGSHGFVFTTTFATGLVAVTLTVATLRRNRACFRLLALILAVSLLLAALQGGAVSNLLLGWTRSERPQAKAVQNQSQAVVVGFPKTHFLSIAKHRTDNSRSCAYSWFPARQFFKRVDHRGARYNDRYLPLWSWGFLKLHWLALFLAPVSGWWLLRRNHEIGLFCWYFGLLSFLTPGLFDFGPVHEDDWFRWLIWTGSGFAASLGLALGSWVQVWSGRKKVAASMLVLLLVWLNTLSGVRYALLDVPREVSRCGGVVKVGLLSRDTDEWLRSYGHNFEVQAVDLEAFRWLREQKVEGQRVLVNFDPSDFSGIEFEATLCGYTGLHAVGHRLPFDWDPVGRPPTRMSAQAHSLLNSSFPSALLLRDLELDWIYLRSNDETQVQRLSNLPGVSERFRRRGRDGRMRVILQVQPTLRRGG